MYFESVSRKLPWAISCESPIASKTWLGSSEPLVQAEPDEAQIPLSLRSKSKLSPSIPSKLILKLFERRLFVSPLIFECGIFESSSNSLSRSLVSCFVISSISFTASSSATDNPKIPARFSVPALLFLSCAPPFIKLKSGKFFLQNSTPTPFGP